MQYVFEASLGNGAVPYIERANNRSGSTPCADSGDGRKRVKRPETATCIRQNTHNAMLGFGVADPVGPVLNAVHYFNRIPLTASG